MRLSRIWRIKQIEEGAIHRGQTPRWITASEIQNISNMRTCINVKFTLDSVRLGLSSPANILQIADVALRVVFLLFLPCF